jgi:hypothetical protein
MHTKLSQKERTIATVAHNLRAKREEAEEQNSRTLGEVLWSIGELAIIVLDMTDALRAEHGNDLANFFVREAHPRNAILMRKAKDELNKLLG